MVCGVASHQVVPASLRWRASWTRVPLPIPDVSWDLQTKADPPCAVEVAQKSAQEEAGEAGAVRCFQGRSEGASPGGEHNEVEEEPGAAGRPTWGMACGCHGSEDGRRCAGCWRAGTESCRSEAGCWEAQMLRASHHPSWG